MPAAPVALAPDGVVAVADLVRVGGPDADLLRAVVARGYVAESWETAVRTARSTGLDVATLDGELARGGHVVVGGGRPDARGILATKGEIKEVRARVDAEREALADLTLRVAAAAAMAGETQHAIEEATARLHQHEKALVGVEAQLSRAREEGLRLDRKGEMLTGERRRAEDEIARLDARQAEARQAIADIESRQVGADQRFTAAQQRLGEARHRVEGLATHVQRPRPSHAGLVERAAALVAEVARLEEASRDLAERIDALSLERTQKTARRVELDQAITEALGRLDAAVASLDALRDEVRSAEEAAGPRADADRQDSLAREARSTLDGIRASATQFEVSQATATADLAHLEATAVETVQATLADVLTEVEQLERDGAAVPDTRALSVDEGVDDGDEGITDQPRSPGRISMRHNDHRRGSHRRLRAKIDKLGPVNMMAIEQFAELETRHTFLTTQRKDLIDSIAQTNEAIQRIDETSKVRFRDAFEAINANFQQTFSTLFGGGHAGITLLDENDPLESGIDIVACPPGKRLQNVCCCRAARRR